ncbi:hypothetical protein WP77_21500 [Salmonella enterica subsp. enterica serovar Kentucky]|nr:hypothetical protein [Salmonella enterica subsp. enterica serovar Kentucky]
MGSCAAPSAKGDDKFITTDYLQQCHYSFGELINNADQYATLAEMIGKCDEVMYLKKKRKTLSRKAEP